MVQLCHRLSSFRMPFGCRSDCCCCCLPPPRLALLQGMLPSLEMLRGEALQHGGGTGPSGVQQPRRIKHLPLERLPQDAGARFAALFAEQTA